MKRILFCALAISAGLLGGCNGQEKKEIPSNKIQVVVEKEEEMELDSNCFFINDITFDNKYKFIQFIEKEKKAFYSQPSSDPNEDYGMQYTNGAIPYIFPIFSYWLQEKKHYTPVSDSIFNTRVKEIFNFNFSDNCDKIQNKTDYTKYTTDYEYIDGYDLLSEGSFLFSPKYKLLFIPPSPSKNDLFYLIEEKSQTKRYKTCFDDKEYYYNQFIFHDSKSSLTWLINNDLDFLEILVREFGYDKEPKINKAILNKAVKEYYSKQPNDRNVLVNLFAKKDCHGNLQIREDLMKFISNNYDKQSDTPIELLSSYASIIFSYPREYPDITLTFTPQERIKLAAYAGYYEQLARYRNNMDSMDASYYTSYEGWDAGGFLRNILVEDNGFLEEIKNNNYYNLSEFKDMIENILYQIEEQSKEYNRTHNFEN